MQMANLRQQIPSWCTSLIIITIIDIVTSAPHHGSANHSAQSMNYNREQFDTIYDEKQNGIENIRFNIDRASLVWTSNSLLGLAALLEPALYGSNDDQSEPNHFEIHLGPEEHGTTDAGHQNVIVEDNADKKAENDANLAVNNNKTSVDKHVEQQPSDDKKSIQKRENPAEVSDYSPGRYRFPELIRTLLVPKIQV